MALYGEKGFMNPGSYGLLSVLVCVASLVLQGCGGGGNGLPVSRDVYDALRADYERAVSDRNAAAAARTTAEAGAMAAEAVRAEAEAAAFTAVEALHAAEARLAAAVAAQAAAEDARLLAETAKLAAQAKARSALEAQEIAEADAAKAKLDKVAGEAALAVAEVGAVEAEKTRARAEAAQVRSETAQARAEGAREIAESAASGAVDARITAEEELNTALAHMRAAAAAQKTAEGARTQAEEDLKTVLEAQVKAEGALANTQLERDQALEALAMQMEAEAAQRARVDARAIKASAGFTIVSGGVDLNGDGRLDPVGVTGEVLPVSGSSTHTLANYQGAQAVLLNLPAGSLSVRAFRSGSTVSVTAAVSQGRDRGQLFRVSSDAGSGDTMEVTDQVRVPGGHTNHIFLMTDIEAPVRVPSTTGSVRTLFDSDYLVYGAWLMRPDSTGGTAYAAAFATGNDLFDPVGAAGNGIAELVGKATYRGSAAGFFAEQYVNVDSAVSGTFTAAAELSADFDAGTVSNGLEGGIVSGTITEFARSDGVPVNWLINLDVLDLGAADGMPPATNTAAPSSAAGGFTPGTTSGYASGVPWTGEWGVQFVGDDAVFAARHPTGVVGTFGAQYGSPMLLTGEPHSIRDYADHAFVTVLGAFGGRKE